ncbi:MAG: cytochrome c [Leptolyngbya sp. SIOISBB]|nr:cytochrome c [Leptolyngbya sp. SIOISBB]
MLITKRNYSEALADNALDQDFADSSLGNQRRLMVVGVLLTLILGILFFVWHAQAADPYVQGVLALEADSDRGHEIFQMNCAVCHGIEANGEVGPSLLGVSARKSKVKLIQQVVSGNTPPMPQFQPEPKDMADLLGYLEQL